MLILTFLSLLLAQILLTHGSNNKEAIGRRSDDLRANSPADIKPAPAEDQFEFDNIPDPADKNQQQQQKIHEHQQSLLRRNKRQLGTPLEETISVTAQIFSGRLFDYGPDHGDKELGQGLDISKKLPLSRPLRFYRREYSAVYVLSNGAIGFDNSAKNYRSGILPGPMKLIAPFWNRNDLQNGGNVYYREVLNGRVLERGQSEIRYQYEREVRIHSAIIVTYDKMQPVGTDPLPSENTNTFQMAIFNTDNETFVNFIYSNIGWTQGAEAGFSSDNNVDGYKLPTSGTGNIMYLEDSGNTGIPGEWMFILEANRVARCKPGVKGDTCDVACASGEWGSDCAECCHCAGNGTCDATTGTCPGPCADCWTGPNCRERKDQCKSAKQRRKCAQNAITLSDFDSCGEPNVRCECLSGFRGDGYIQCVDIDECSIPGTCHEKAKCINTPGRFFCQCMEGFSGDGATECVASILYPYEESQGLSKERRAKVDWKLKQPLAMLGKERSQITILRNGLIVAEGLTKQGAGERLEDMDILGMTPFYTGEPMDGEILIKETIDNGILSRISKMINEHIEDPSFAATSSLIITFLNITNKRAQKTNTFQLVLSGGKSTKNNEAQTYAAFLYKDLVLDQSAEAGVMTADKSSSIQLPGSGTPGIEQLSQLSNVRSPGIWLYRVDKSDVFPCIQEGFQPPYCDAKSPPLVSRKQQRPTTPAAKIASETTTTAIPSKSSPITPAVQRPLPPSIPVFQPQKVEPVGRRPLAKVTPAFPTVESRQWTADSERPPLTSSAAVSSSSSSEEQHHDVFEVTTTQKSRPPPKTSKAPSSIQTAAVDGKKAAGRGSAVEISIEQDHEEEEADQQTADQIVVVPDVVKPDVEKKQLPAGGKGEEIQKQIPIAAETPASKASRAKGLEKAANKQPEIEFLEDKPKEDSSFTSSRGQAEVVLVDRPVGTIIPQRVTPPPSEISRGTQPTQTPPTTVRPSSTSGRKQIEALITAEPIQFEPNDENSEQPFTQTSSTTGGEADTKPSTSYTNSPETTTQTTTTLRPSPTPPVSVQPKQSKYPKLKTENGEETTVVETVPDSSDPTRIFGADLTENKLPVIMVVGIVAAWLVVLVGVSVFVCCRRRKTRGQLRMMYGPAYQIRPVSAGFTLRNDKHLYEGHYDEHLNKMARLSSELNAYYPCGGRYPAAGTACNNTRWNLSPDGVSSGGESSGGGGGSASKERCSLAEDAATTTASAFFNNYTPSSSTAATGGGGSPPIGGGFGGGQEGSLIPGRAFTHLQQGQGSQQKTTRPQQ